MKTYVGVDIYIRISLTSALAGAKLSGSCPDLYTPGEYVHNTHKIGGWVHHRVCLELVEKRKSLTPTGIRIPVFQDVARHYSD
jgi:hypothetical protein